jgi:hypothetical protein
MFTMKYWTSLLSSGIRIAQKSMAFAARISVRKTVKNTSTEDLRLVSCGDYSSGSTWFDIGIVPAGVFGPAANSDILARSQVGG